MQKLFFLMILVSSLSKADTQNCVPYKVKCPTGTVIDVTRDRIDGHCSVNKDAMAEALNKCMLYYGGKGEIEEQAN